MVNRRWIGYGKFFRGLIAASRPEDIPEILEKYSKQQKTLESNYLDIVLSCEGAISYEDIIVMPIPSIELLVERINARHEKLSGKSKQML